MKISIIVPVYNVAPYLRECLDSILAQTYTDWEAICVDDGSTDGSGSILDEYAEKVQGLRFKVIHQANQGVSAARNAGLELATGGYVTFVDGDDLVDREWFETANRIVGETNADIIRFRCRTTFERCRDADYSYSVYAGVSALAWGRKIFFEQGWSCVNFIRRELCARFPEGMRLCEDNIFMLNTLSHVSRTVQCEFNGYIYRNRDGAATRSLFSVKDCIRILDEVDNLSYERTQEFVMACSIFIWRVLFWWYNNRIVEEKYAGLCQRVQKAHKKGDLRLGFVPIKAVFALLPFITAQSILGFRLVGIASRVKNLKL